MNGIFLFLTQFLIAYLVLGCLLTGAIALSLRCFSLNAAARHRVWLTALIVLVLAPMLIFLPDSKRENFSSTATGEVPPIFSALSLEPSAVIEDTQVLASARPAAKLLGVNAAPRQAAILTAGPVQLKAWSQALLRSPLSSELAISLMLLLAVGIGAKLFLYMRSLRALGALIASCETVEGEWADALTQSAQVMRMSGRTELLHSRRVSTPSTCGVLYPRIILPSAMLRDGCYKESRTQVLQHELAHIKRHDPLVAGVQAVVSIFLFWHPAVHFVNQRIRFEREIACDDWVVSNSAQYGDISVKAYALGIVDIAESLRRHATPAHSVACVNTSQRLQERIRTLLDQGADHSTTVNLMPKVWVASMAFGFMFVAATQLPKLPAGIFQNEVAAVATTHTLSRLSSIVSEEPEDRGLDSVPIAPTIEPSHPPLAEYATPHPIPEFIPNLADEKSSLVLARADRIESSFVSKAVGVGRENGLPIEVIKPVLEKVAPVSLDEIVDQQEGIASFALVRDLSESEETDLVIIDSLSRSELAGEILKIELELYRVFNALTDRNDLKMHCAAETILGSYIDKTICEPEFLRSARSEHLLDSMTGNANYVWVGQETTMQAQYAELANEILKEMKSNRYLFELYQVLAGLRERFAEIA